MAGESVYVLAETTDGGEPTALTGELLGLGSELAARTGGKVHAVVIGIDLDRAALDLVSMGADEVHVADHDSLKEYNPDLYMGVLDLFLERHPEGVLLAGHTGLGEDLTPRIAFSTGSGLVTDCVGVEVGVGEGETTFIKPTFGGNALVSFTVKTPLKMATVRSRVGRSAPRSPGEGTVSPMDVEDTEPRVRAIKRVVEEKGVKLEEAPVVVSGGRGIGGPEGFEEIQRLAGLLGGAVGASRPPVDSGWIPSPCQVGMTGKIVAPDLYIAVAISGSSQHLSGMSEAGKIVAVNRDPEAYIFKVSDYGVVGDWARVLPAFAEKLKELMNA